MSNPSFGVSYAEFQLFLVLPAIAAAAMAARSRLVAGARSLARPVSAILLCSLIWTTPWDNYLVARGIWSYGPDRVLMTIGWVPIEEYLFFLLQPLLVVLVYLAVPSPPATDDTDRRSHGHGMSIATGAWLLASVAGLGMLPFPRATYAALIIIWAAPVLAAQCWIAGRSIATRRRPLAIAVIAATVVLCVADRVAIAQGIWSISPATSSGFLIFGLPAEEALFFLLTNLLVVQGFVLFMPRHL